MTHKHLCRLYRERGSPSHQSLVIRMATDPGQDLNVCPYRYLLAEQPDTLRPVNNRAAGGAHSLVAHEQYRALRSPEVVLQVMLHTSGITHTAGGYDYLRSLVKIDRL